MITDHDTDLDTDQCVDLVTEHDAELSPDHDANPNADHDADVHTGGDSDLLTDHSSTLPRMCTPSWSAISRPAITRSMVTLCSAPSMLFAQHMRSDRAFRAAGGH
jgi:hypothetical protein